MHLTATQLRQLCQGLATHLCQGRIPLSGTLVVLRQHTEGYQHLVGMQTGILAA